MLLRNIQLLKIIIKIPINVKNIRITLQWKRLKFITNLEQHINRILKNTTQWIMYKMSPRTIWNIIKIWTKQYIKNIVHQRSGGIFERRIIFIIYWKKNKNILKLFYGLIAIWGLFSKLKESFVNLIFMDLEKLDIVIHISRTLLKHNRHT